MNPLLRQAVTEQQRNNFTQAFKLYTKFLEESPNDPDGLFLFGLFAAQRGDLSKGLDLLTKSLNQNRLNADVHYNLAVIYIKLSKFTDALHSLESALTINPQLVEAHFNIGLIHSAEKNFDEALNHLTRAINLKPDLSIAFFKRGLVYLEMGQNFEALKDFDTVIATDPHHFDALFNAGIALQKMGLLADALNRYEIAVQIKPNWVDPMVNMGVTLTKLKRFDEALNYFNRALALDPNAADIWSNKGIALSKIRKYSEAAFCFDRALEIDSEYAEAWCNKGNNHHSASQFSEAISCFDRALGINPRYAEAWSNKGVTLSYLHQFEKAIECYQKAIFFDDKYLDAKWNLAVSQLSTGNFKDGWENYEYRWHIANPIPTKYNNIARLNSLDQLPGKSLLIWAEQGLGDTIQFCRFIPEVKKLGANISFVVQHPLRELLKNLTHHCEIYTEDELSSINFDFQSPLLSLPRLFFNSGESFPKDIPYLAADHAKSLYWKSHLGSAGRFKVGLVWNGGFRADQPEVWAINERRNIPLETISKLRLVPGIDFYSLQKGEPAESECLAKINLLWPEANFHNYTSELHNFSDTAALVNNLDLVISVDTSTAHLAGALGKPVWILNRYDACWRWLVNRTDTPWYPTARLFHQKQSGNWDQLIDEVYTELETALLNCDK